MLDVLCKGTWLRMYLTMDVRSVLRGRILVMQNKNPPT